MKKEGANKKLIIAIVIGILIVVSIVIGVFFPDLGIGKTAPDPVSEQCKFACDSGQTYSFCSAKRETSDGVKATCKELSGNSQYSKYGVEPCPAIKC